MKTRTAFFWGMFFGPLGYWLGASLPFMPAVSASGLAGWTIGALSTALCVTAWDWLWDFFERRAERKWRLILSLLSDGCDWYGLDLVKASGGLLKRGTVYVTLLHMERAGLVSATEESGGPERMGWPRYRYRLTDAGRNALETA